MNIILGTWVCQSHIMACLLINIALEKIVGDGELETEALSSTNLFKF